MDLTKITAISPIDGRYREMVSDLSSYFSEYGLIKYRIIIEILYFERLCDVGIPQLKDFPNKFQELKSLYENFDAETANVIKALEKETNHDVKAVEYWLKSKFDELDLTGYKEFIHFGLTSQDINNTAIPMLIKEAMAHEYFPLMDEILDELNHFSRLWQDIPMLARTHGQPASPTTLGKEILVFETRIKHQLAQLKSIPYSAKFGGATGNFNAHFVVFPDIHWHKFADNFIEGLGLKRSHPTTQIEHYDNMAGLFDNIRRINTILIDLCRDIWHYISLNYFHQKTREGEVGSSAMPHKVNPIDFENAEGNLGLSNALLIHLSTKLPVSRLQRDLTDSTVLRNVGVAFAHIIIAFKSLSKGFQKLELNKSVLDKDLEDNWVVVAEGIQNILRSVGYPEPYEALLALTRNKQINKEDIHTFIENLDVDNKLKKRLKDITPFNYIGQQSGTDQPT